MVTATEASKAKTPLGATMDAGIDTISYYGSIVFTKYIKAVLPVDGYVFWVKADLLAAGAAYNANAYNTVSYAEPPALITPAPTVTIEGSFHFATDKRQLEDETIAVNRVVFTAEQPIQDFNQIGPAVMFIATFQTSDDATPIRFAFSRRGYFYDPAGTYHYEGEAIYPALESQIIDTPSLDMVNRVVSNSLPIWLSIPSFNAVWWKPGWNWPLFPSFVVPDNIAPPYATIHIDPSQTQAIQAVPFVNSESSDYQLSRDLVRITIYGTRNTDARSFLISILDYMRNVDMMGLMNMPDIREEKRTQAELSIIAMKKVIDFEVSYNQGASRAIARQLIEQALATVIPEFLVII